MAAAAALDRATPVGRVREARGSEKGGPRSSQVCFIGREGDGGATAGAMDINVYGGGRSSMHPREGALIREKRRGIDGRGVKEGYYRALMGRIEEGGARGTRAAAGGGVAVAAWPRWEEEDGADARAPSVSGWKREEALVGRRGETGPRVGRRWSGPAGLGWGLLFFFSNPFQSNFKPF
jgi:hypothetical protein